MKIKKEKFTEMLLCGLIIDARKGGLINGREHNSGGIKLLIEAEEIFKVIGELEGFEFLVNSSASKKHRKRIEEINSDIDKNRNLDFSNYRLTHKTIIHNTKGDVTRDTDTTKILWIDPEMFIVNKWSTVRYIYELESINLDINPYL